LRGVRGLRSKGTGRVRNRDLGREEWRAAAIRVVEDH
jgi:hypothetical protein